MSIGLFCSIYNGSFTRRWSVFFVQVCLVVLLFCWLGAGAALLSFVSSKAALLCLFFFGVFHLDVAPIVTLLFGSSLYILCRVYFLIALPCQTTRKGGHVHVMTPQLEVLNKGPRLQAEQ